MSSNPPQTQQSKTVLRLLCWLVYREDRFNPEQFLIKLRTFGTNCTPPDLFGLTNRSTLIRRPWLRAMFCKSIWEQRFGQQTPLIIITNRTNALVALLFEFFGAPWSVLLKAGTQIKLIVQPSPTATWEIESIELRDITQKIETGDLDIAWGSVHHGQFWDLVSVLFALVVKLVKVSPSIYIEFIYKILLKRSPSWWWVGH